jgi:hypothetical protein
MPYYPQRDTYPIFLECCDYIKDDFWMTIFKDMSNGKLPYGIHINNKRTLTTHYKNKNFNYVYHDKHPKDIFYDLKELLVENFGLRSRCDNVKYEEKLKENLKDITENRDNIWKSIKRNSIKTILLINYVIENKHIYNLDAQISKNLLYDLKCFLYSKQLISDDIILEDGKIKEITLVKYSNNNYFIEITREPKYTKPIEKFENLMITHWLKVLNKPIKEDPLDSVE